MSERAVRLLEPHLARPGAYTAVRQAAAATQAGRFAHLGDALAETAAPAGLDLGFSCYGTGRPLGSASFCAARFFSA